MKKTFFITILSHVVAASAFAQGSFDDFMKNQQGAFNQFVSDKQAEYDAFRKRVNEQYADFMRQAWQPIDMHEADIPKDEKTEPPVIYKPEPTPQPEPKPQPTPKPQPEPTPKPQPEPTPKPQPEPQPAPTPTPEPAPKPIAVKPDVVVVPKPKPAPKPIAPVKPKEETPYNNVSISYYGTLVTIAFPKNDNLRIGKLSENALADAWAVLSDNKYDITIKTALDCRQSLSLCDWAYMDMLKQITQKQYGKTNEAVLTQAFLMTQSGYRVRLGKASDKLYMLVASDYTIYKMKYITLDGKKFYIIEDGNRKGSLDVCPAKYAKEQSLTMQIATLPKLGNNPTPKRKLTSRKGITASVSVNSNLLDFFTNYPAASINNDFTTRWAAYANTPLDKGVSSALYPILRGVVSNMSELDAVNILLNWVQTAFEYGYDDQIWGGDRAFFAQETLYYPYSDCEDRSILFSRLVRDILGLDVVLLYYPGHLATAVAFTKPVNGDYLTYKNRKYVVCDPTYANAPVGKTMPNKDNSKATIIALK